jgi:hypothetical protein
MWAHRQVTRADRTGYKENDMESSTLKTEAAGSSEMFVPIYKRHGGHIAQNHNLNIHFRENVRKMLRTRFIMAQERAFVNTVMNFWVL